MASDLLHEALIRKMRIDAAMRGEEARSPPSVSSSHSNYDSEEEGDIYTPVHTRPSTPMGTPRRTMASTSTSSARGTPAGSRSTSPSGGRAKRKLQDEAERKASRDPLKKFENEISSRIFKELDTRMLARCLRVSKRWNRSATINWCWYLRFQERRLEGPLNTDPIWTRKESKENWPQRYRSAFTLNGLQYQTAIEMDIEKARSDGYRTPKEEREERWASEAGGGGGGATSNGGGGGGALNTVFGGDRNAAREYYKAMGGRTKIKGKGGQGSSSGPRDRTAFGEDSEY